MEDLVRTIAEAPVANLFIISGLLFIAIAVLGKISGKIEPSRAGRLWAGILGTLFLAGGLTLHLVPLLTASRTPKVTPLVAAQPTSTTAKAVDAPTSAPTREVVPPTAPPAQPTVAPTSAPAKAPAANLPAGSWAKLPDLPRMINGWAVDPTNPQVVYAGTGDSGSGGGVFRSQDAGLTWARVANGLPEEDVEAVALACDDGCTLLAALMRDVYGSSDGGTSWARLGDPGVFGAMHYQFYVRAGDSGTVYLVAQPTGPVRSVDGGSTWMALSGGLPGDDTSVYVLCLAIDPNDPMVLYAGTGGWVGHGQGVWKSVDGGDTWTLSNRGMLDLRISALAVDPSNSQRVYAGADSGELFISDDAGQTWREVTKELPKAQSSHPTVQDIIIDPANAQSVYLLANYRGVIHSPDGGETWRLLGVPGEDNQTAYTRMAVIHGQQPIILVGAEREGAWRYTGEAQ
jgi:hypothetical protein